jgi:phosphohistidine phosphatase SixA
MKLLLVRHAEAVDVGGPIRSDRDRHLTARGLATAARLAAALRGRVELDAVVCSPYLRTRQTAEPLLALAPAGAELVFCAELVPDTDDPKAVAATLAGLGVKRLAVVSHLPELMVLAAWLMGGGVVNFDRGSAALIRTDKRVSRGGGELQWLVSPEWYE